MKFISICLVLLAVVIGGVSSSLAQDNLTALSASSGENKPWPGNNLCTDKTGCICKADLSKFPITIPKGMSLVSICNYQMTDGEISQGDLYFKGKVTVQGKVIAARRGEAGDYYSFEKRLGKEDVVRESLFSIWIDDLRLDKNQGNIKLPPLSDENICWSADAVLTIRQLRVALSERDDAGNYPEDFEAVKIGKFSKCKLEY